MARFNLNLRELNPFTRTVNFFGRLSTNFGWRFVVILLSAYIGVKGITSQLTYSAYFPYMRNYVGVTKPTEYQAFYTVSRLPWSLKATIGMVSDAFPIGGYYKRYYLLGPATFGSISCAMLAAAPINKIGGGVTAALLLFILTLEHASGTSWGSEGVGGGIVARCGGAGRGGTQVVRPGGGKLTFWSLLQCACLSCPYGCFCYTPGVPPGAVYS